MEPVADDETPGGWSAVRTVLPYVIAFYAAWFLYGLYWRFVVQ